MSDITHTIKELELSLLKPEVRSSRDTLDKLLADDFVEHGTSGNTYSKLDILERLPNSPGNTKYTMSDFSVEMLSEDVAIAKFKTEKIADGKDKVISQRISHWRKTNKGWQIFFHEGKRID